MPTFGNRLKHAWNAFLDRDNSDPLPPLGPSYSTNQSRVRFRIGNERSIIASIYNRISLDVAAFPIRHVRLDENGEFIDFVNSGLNNCLSVEPNIDQAPRSFSQDIVLSMFDEGVVGIVPIDTTINPSVSGSYDINTMRTGKITEWFPEHVRINVFNHLRQQRQDLILPKKNVAIVENPLYLVMNEPNSTLQRLIAKLNLLDVIDQQSGSGKLDIIIQLPYLIRSEARRQQAENRRNDIESQLADSKYGIAYTDGTEKITQLNRPAENNLMTQIEFLTAMLYGQLGLTKEIFEGNADENVLLNYYNRTVEPIISAITEAMTRTFLTRTARTQGQWVIHMKDPFKNVTISSLGSVADSFKRNAILSSNELRGIIGFSQSTEKNADSLENPNIAKSSSDTQSNQNNQNGRKLNEQTGKI